jgi:hypothetical protein
MLFKVKTILSEKNKKYCLELYWVFTPYGLTMAILKSTENKIIVFSNIIRLIIIKYFNIFTTHWQEFNDDLEYLKIILFPLIKSI